MQRCGLCSLLADLLCRAVCGASHDSSESRKDSRADWSIDENMELKLELTKKYLNELSMTETDEELLKAVSFSSNLTTGRFLTLHRRRRKCLTTRSLEYETGLLDDIFNGQVERILFNANAWQFNAFTLENVTGGRALPVLGLHLFKQYNLFSRFHLDVASVWKLFSLIEEGYHSANPYHNSIHAADVTQAMHCFLSEPRVSRHLEPVEVLASLIAAMAHDVDHPGVNQPFLMATDNHLAVLYKEGDWEESSDNQNSSVLENHHWRSAVSCLVESGVADVIQPFWEDLKDLLCSLILATDITRQGEFLEVFKKSMDDNTLDMSNVKDRRFVLQIALKCSDISNPCRSWDVSRKWSLRVCEEFFRQGDYERELNLPLSFMCDRFSTSIPKIQTGFFKCVVSPLMSEWDRFNGSGLSALMLDNLQINHDKWEKLEIEEEAATVPVETIEEGEETQHDIVCHETSLLLVKSPEDRRGSAPAEPKKRSSAPAVLRRESLPLDSKVAIECKELEFKDSIFRSHSSPKIGLSKETKKQLITANNLLPDRSIVLITSKPKIKKLNEVLFRDRSINMLKRQMSFPPADQQANTRGYSSKIVLDNIRHISRGGGDSHKLSSESIDKMKMNIINQIVVTQCKETGVEKKVSQFSVLPDDCHKENLDPRSCFQPRRVSAPVGSQNISEVEEPKSDMNKEIPNPVTGTNSNESDTSRKDAIAKASSKQAMRRSSAPPDPLADMRGAGGGRGAIAKSRARKKCLFRRSSGGPELVLGWPDDSGFSRAYTQTSSSCQQRANYRRRGSLPCEDLTMSGNNFCH